MVPEYEDEVKETWNVIRAMNQLQRQDPMWTNNVIMLERCTPRNRILWWRSAKKQAQLGAPAMQTLLLKVIELRLTE